ncbi:MAG: hypothetical protein CMH56_13420 [Myxococcales bacterium]|nr:hypothetical protein [Myxococcales bacterium]
MHQLLAAGSLPLLLLLGCPSEIVEETPVSNEEVHEQEEETPEPASDAGQVPPPAVHDAGHSDSNLTSTSDAGAMAQAEVSDAGFALPEMWFKCDTDADCVLYEEGCCDYCNGGTLWSVNEDYLDELQTVHPDPTAEECMDMMCTRMYCQPREAVCSEGMCSDRMVPLGGDDDADDAGAQTGTEDAHDAGGPSVLPGDVTATDAGSQPASSVMDAGHPPNNTLSDAGQVEEGDPAEWYTCQANSDCVLEQRGCCDWCAGGQLYSVNEDHLSAFEAAYPPTETPCLMPNGEPMACPMIMCLGQEAYCNAGTCDHRLAGSGDDVTPIDDTDENQDGYPDIWFSCEEVNDCVTYQPECCDACSGGELYAVNTAYLSAVQEAIPSDYDTPGLCSNVQCLGVFCTISLSCENNVCGAEVD